MTKARGLAAVLLLAIMAAAMQERHAGAQTATDGETVLAPDQAAAPAERPGKTPDVAPAEGTTAPAIRPDGAPTPAPRPDAAADAEAPEKTGAGDSETPAAPAPEVPAAATEAPTTAPAPAEDPDVGAEAPARAPQPEEPPVPEQLAEDDAALAACLGRLQAAGAVFERIDPFSGSPEGASGDEGASAACGIANPIRVTEIVPSVTLEPAGVMRCATAAALSDWVGDFVLPASRMLPGRGRLSAVENGSAYVCRRIGGAGGSGANGGGDLSQHAFGNAVDIMGFRFVEGPAIPVEPREREGTPAEAFQRTARASACLLFTTVLGPGEADHEDHLHLDIQDRESDFRLCQ